jgi:hypothetical protein
VYIISLNTGFFSLERHSLMEVYPLNTHISGSTLMFHNSWKASNYAYVIDLLLEDGQWKNIDDFV